MNIISVDNCYEDDGLVQAQQFLYMCNIPPPDGTPQDVLIAVIPEYRADGKLDRLNFCTRPSGEPHVLSDNEVKLRLIAAAVIADRKAAHDAAIAKLEEPIVVAMPEPQK